MSSHKPPVRNSLPATHAASTVSAPKPKPTNNASRAPAKPSTSSQGPNEPSSDPRHLAIALHHAHRIQSQKDSEALILDRILDLITLPSSPTADPAAPSPADAHALKSALVPFQPSDYDNLIEERNIEGRCGYPLCPRPHRTENAFSTGANGSYRITWGAKGSGPGGRGRSMNIVPRESLEKWCSDECAERALYIRVQLAAEPVWERRAADVAGGQEILLLEEGRAAQSGQVNGKGKARSTDNPPSVRNVTGQLENLSMDVDSVGRGPGDVAGDMARLSVRDEGRAARALALERGDSVEGAWGDGRVGVCVRENDLGGAAAVAPRMGPGDDRGGSIEGYVPAP